MEKMYKAFFESVITKNVLIDDAVAAFLDWQVCRFLSWRSLSFSFPVTDLDSLGHHSSCVSRVPI